MIKLRVAGEGTYGRVYYARDREHQEFAVKRNLVDRGVHFTGSLRELDLLYRIRGHPYLINLISVSHGTPFATVLSPLQEPRYKDDNVHFVFEKADFDLRELIYARDPSYPQLKRAMLHSLLGLEYLHGKGIIHRDLKPENLLYFAQTQTTKICDFGLSKFTTRQGAQTPRIVTCWYRAPEIACQWPNYTTKSDLWSLGCIFYEMLSKTALLLDVPDKDTMVFQRILQGVPEASTPANVRKLTRNPRYNLNLAPKCSRNWHQFVGLGTTQEHTFNESPGTYIQYLDLLKHLLDLDPETRFSATEALAHPFWQEYQEEIAAARAAWPPEPPAASLLAVSDIQERRWAMQVARTIYANRTLFGWYSHRILFQAIDMFDRYLEWLQHNGEPVNLESDLTGRYLSYYEVQLRFSVCVYVAIKYFTSMQAPIAFTQLCPAPFHTPEAMASAEEFETFLVREVFHYALYRETIYEAADYYQEVLTEPEIEQLLQVYTELTSYSGLSSRRLYKLVRFALAGPV